MSNHKRPLSPAASDGGYERTYSDVSPAWQNPFEYVYPTEPLNLSDSELEQQTQARNAKRNKLNYRDTSPAWQESREYVDSTEPLNLSDKPKAEDNKTKAEDNEPKAEANEPKAEAMKPWHKCGHMARVEAISACLKTHVIYLVNSCFLFFNAKNTRGVC